jgi:hypothetical protein
MTRINDATAGQALNTDCALEAQMQALKELFTTDVGLLSIGVIVFMLGMGGFYLRFFLQHMRQDEERQRSMR